ncbi:MAG TPA: amidohydrolase family protein [Chloroflexota bacterium]|nr:amidohydrolase family protein [Chloroflexota bacterium]
MNHVIDADRHVEEPLDLWTTRMSAQFRDRAPRPADPNGDPYFFDVDGEITPSRPHYAHRALRTSFVRSDEDRYAAAREDRFGPKSQLTTMDVEGIDLAVMFPTRGLYVAGVMGRDNALMNDAARAYNDWLAELCQAGHGRLFGVGMLNLRDPEGAAKETKRCVEQLGFVGMFARPNRQGEPFFDETYDPLWALLDDLQTPVCFHEGNAVPLPQAGASRFTKHGMWHVCTHPMENQMAMVEFVLGGVLERHPGLKAGFLECGAGWLPYWMWRLDEADELDHEHDFEYLQHKPSDYVKRQCFVSIDSDEETGPFALGRLGGRHVIWGSDFPHDDGKYPNGLKLLRGLEGMTAEFAQQVLWDNPLEFYNPKLREAASSR